MSDQDHLSVRLRPEEIKRVDAVRAELSTEWHPATWSDVLRALILAGLGVYERKRKATAEPQERQRRARRRSR